MSARVGKGREFVVEADEYDTAFFDKRSKFVHYRPMVAILNNLEYDHADIFPDIAAIPVSYTHLDVYKRQILGYACFHLAHQVRAHVGALGEDAAAQAREDRDQ